MFRTLGIVGVVFVLGTSTAAGDEVRDGLEDMLNAGYDMEPLRSSSDPAELSQCADQMEANQATVEDLRSQISEMPDSDYMFHLSMVAVDMNSCVSCKPNALESCDTAAELLHEADEMR